MHAGRTLYHIPPALAPVPQALNAGEAAHVSAAILSIAKLWEAQWGQSLRRKCLPGSPQSKLIFSNSYSGKQSFALKFHSDTDQRF